MNWGSSKLINESLLTFDCEWAPNFILEHVSNLLIESEVKSTWFVTNESAIIEELKQNSLFELGIHPNFYPGSSQGEDSDSVLKNLKKNCSKIQIYSNSSFVTIKSFVMQVSRIWDRK